MKTSQQINPPSAIKDPVEKMQLVKHIGKRSIAHSG